MLTLFTNRREMEKCFEEVQPALKGDDLRVVCQKWGVSVKGPVSYTHLDVYKRQASRTASSSTSIVTLWRSGAGETGAGDS